MFIAFFSSLFFLLVRFFSHSVSFCIIFPFLPLLLSFFHLSVLFRSLFICFFCVTFFHSLFSFFIFLSFLPCLFSFLYLRISSFVFSSSLSPNFSCLFIFLPLHFVTSMFLFSLPVFLFSFLFFSAFSTFPRFSYFLSPFFPCCSCFFVFHLSKPLCFSSLFTLYILCFPCLFFLYYFLYLSFI